MVVVSKEGVLLLLTLLSLKAAVSAAVEGDGVVAVIAVMADAAGVADAADIVCCCFSTGILSPLLPPLDMIAVSSMITKLCCSRRKVKRAQFNSLFYEKQRSMEISSGIDDGKLESKLPWLRPNLSEYIIKHFLFIDESSNHFYAQKFYDSIGSQILNGGKTNRGVAFRRRGPKNKTLRSARCFASLMRSGHLNLLIYLYFATTTNDRSLPYILSSCGRCRR